MKYYIVSEAALVELEHAADLRCWKEESSGGEDLENARRGLILAKDKCRSEEIPYWATHFAQITISTDERGSQSYKLVTSEEIRR